MSIVLKPTQQVRITDRRLRAIEFRMVREHGVFDPVEGAFFINHVCPELTILDIGAHTGYYSLIAATLEPTTIVHAFEPDPQRFQTLQANLALNRADNVRPHNLALIRDPTLDAFLNDEARSQVDFIKLNAAEADLAILQGAQHLLAKDEAPDILFKLSHLQAQAAGYTVSDLTSYLEEFGYTIHVLSETQLLKPLDGWDGAPANAVARKFS